MKKRILIFIIIIYLSLLSYIVNTAPPQPHNVRGTIYNNNSGYATGGIPITINNTINGDYKRTRTNGVGPDFIDASYSATINGSDNDVIIVTAWNSTNYGTNTTTLLSTTTYANIILNTTRPSETNVTITIPTNSSLFNITGYFNVTARIAIIGGNNAQGCSATISFDNSNVLKLATGWSASDNLNNINLGSFKTSSWNVSANSTGNSSITVHASCTSDDLNFDNVSTYTIYNVTVQDVITPIVQLESPENNSKFTISNIPTIFKYNVSDSSNIKNCSLILNGKINKTNNTIKKYISQNFSLVIINNTYNWSVNCTDNSSNYNIGSSSSFNLTILPNFAPTVTILGIDNPIDLTPGLNTTIYCNATISDQNNVSDIRIINSTFYHNSVQALSKDDDNNHYTNFTCRNVSKDEYDINVSCSFNANYFANNGTWTCNISASDSSSANSSANITTIINDLLAIEITPTTIDYGKLEAGQSSLSDFTVNITNIGNVDFNLTLDGYGRLDGDGLAMNCTKGDVLLMYEKYYNQPGRNYNNMKNLTDTPTQVGNMTVPQRINDTTYKNDRNYTYWKMGLPYATSGTCSGFVRFIAVLAER